MSKSKRMSKFDELVVDLIKNTPDKTLSRQQILSVLRLESKNEIKRLDKALNRLANSGELHRNGDKVSLAKKETKQKSTKKNKDEIIGKLDISAGGVGYVIVENLDEDIRVSNKDLGFA